MSRQLSREVRSPPKNQGEQKFYKNKDGSGTRSGGRTENRGGESIIGYPKLPKGRHREGKERRKTASTAKATEM